MDNQFDSNQQSDQSFTSQPPKFWLSLEQWRGDPEFQKLAEQEFLSSPLKEGDDDSGWARREFLKLMGASLALTSFGCVRRPAQKIIPYVNRPEEIVPGLPNYYASSFVDGNIPYGIVVTTREGRPIKIEGNPSHPGNGQGLSARALAHVLAVYDPDRATQPQKKLFNEKKTNSETVSYSWEKMDKEIAEQLKKGNAALLTSSVLSPSLRAMIASFCQAYGIEHVIWDGMSVSANLAGQEKSYGKAEVPGYRFDRARVIVSVEGDFLGTYIHPTEFQKQFASGRKLDGEMNKLVVFESLLSLTGANADTRFRIRPSQKLTVVMGLAHELIVKKGMSRFASDGAVKAILEPYANAAKDLGVSATDWNDVVAALAGAKGKSLIVSGGISSMSSEALALQVAVNFLNSALDNEGSTIVSRGSYNGMKGSDASLIELTQKIHEGRIKSLVIWGVNPVYSAPDALRFSEALKKAEMVVYTGDRSDETGAFAGYLAPEGHSVENWGDLEATEGVFSIQQPTLRPLHNTRSFLDSMMAWMKVGGKAVSAENSYEYVRNFWKQNLFPKQREAGLSYLSFEDFWVYVLQNGVLDTAGNERNAIGGGRSFNSSALQLVKDAKISNAADLELVLYPTVGLMDGSLANVSWLQEFPDPVTKICWDNYLVISPLMAEKMKLREGQVAKVKASGNEIELPVHIQPGVAEGVVGLAIGFGRTGAGKVANGVGKRVLQLAKVEGNQFVFAGLPAEVTVTSNRIPLANTQGHHSMEGRQIIVEATLEQYKKRADANIHRHKMFSIWDEHKYTGHKWGMTVDLNLCNGCSACVIACQSENNIPTVGKKYVLQGREMHWIRIDRYYAGSPEAPDSLHQPVLCMHCDNAPCETVCPVIATMHSEEGTNDMIYNRCVGTRYCANNCPYKVRRFNWFDYTDMRAPLHMALNPEVTVRARGVMEKCTFCKHKIVAGKEKAKQEARPVKDGDIKTACQQACPTHAIVFGDLNDPQSEVAKLFKTQRAYDLLEELNNKPAVRYMSKVRNAKAIKSERGGHGTPGKDGHGASAEGGHHS